MQAEMTKKVLHTMTKTLHEKDVEREEALEAFKMGPYAEVTSELIRLIENT